MLNKLVIPDMFFDFDTEEEYYSARISGYIPDYSMARITREHSNGSLIDYPCHSREEFIKNIAMWISHEDVVSIEAYHSIHYYDIQDYD